MILDTRSKEYPTIGIVEGCRVWKHLTWFDRLNTICENQNQAKRMRQYLVYPFDFEFQGSFGSFLKEIYSLGEWHLLLWEIKSQYSLVQMTLPLWSKTSL